MSKIVYIFVHRCSGICAWVRFVCGGVQAGRFSWVTDPEHTGQSQEGCDVNKEITTDLEHLSFTLHSLCTRCLTSKETRVLKCVYFYLFHHGFGCFENHEVQDRQETPFTPLVRPALQQTQPWIQTEDAALDTDRAPSLKPARQAASATNQSPIHASSPKMKTRPN